MAHGGEPARPAAAETTELGVPGAAKAGEVHITSDAGMLDSQTGAMSGAHGEFAHQGRPGAGRGGVVSAHHVPRSDLALLHGYSGQLTVQRRPVAGAGHGGGELVLRALCDDSGTLAAHLWQLLPVAGIAAVSAAAAGVATGAASPAAGIGFFALLLGGVSLVMIHMLRA